MKRIYSEPTMVIYEMKSSSILAGSGFEEGETGNEVIGGGVVDGGGAL